jgi:hypothetical protein
MRFEERELKPFAEPITVDELTEDSVYFLVNFVDDDMLIPQMETLVFIGKNLEDNDTNFFYFQDIDSYQEGVRITSSNSDNYATFSKCTINELNGIYNFENALDVLMWCLLRRKEKNI